MADRAMHHLNVRVAWHDSKWSGYVCRAPSKNTFCLDLDRIRAERNDAAEDKVAGTHFSELAAAALPPCQGDSGAFMSDKEWCRTFEHPYAENQKAQATHGQLRPTLIKVPPYSTFAVPFYWMLRKNQAEIDDGLPQPLPPDESPPFPSPWVFSRTRQEGLSELFFGRLTEKQSLVFFYTKSGHPLDETISRLIIGVGQIDWLSKLRLYETSGRNAYPMWDRLFTHSIRPDGHRGFLLPYHQYLETTGDRDEDERRRSLVQEIVVEPERAHITSFSYVGELARPDIALSSLVRCLGAVRKIRAHGIAEGPWDKREEWLNEQIAQTWKERGAFPGTGAALEALGMRLGTSMVLELMARGQIASGDDPWPILDGILRGRIAPPQKAYTADVQAIAGTWASLPEDRRALVKLLSRFELSTEQASRWFDPKERKSATSAQVSDRDILENPYRIVETDLGDANERPVSLGAIDRGLMPDDTVRAAHPVPEPSAVGAPLDVRRVRAAFVTVLRRASERGDTLLSEEEALEDLGKLDLSRPCTATADWILGNLKTLEAEIARFDLKRTDRDDNPTPCLQLKDFQEREKRLSSILRRRAVAMVATVGEKWRDRLLESLNDQDVTVDLKNARHVEALQEQAQALEQITTRKLSVLVGGAGTGKTTVLGALMKATRLSQGGILFLAPTGKARVRLGQKTGAAAMTVAQFLYQRNRYDPLRQRPRFEGDPAYAKEKTVVIDESSMLTLDDLYAVFVALDLAHVQRIILVGDPNQLPPIGVGRPFADLVAFLDRAGEGANDAAKALSRLTVEVRTSAGAPSDSLRLASWFTREPQPVDADRVLSELEAGGTFNDLEVHYWQTPQQLHQRLSELFVSQLVLLRHK